MHYSITKEEGDMFVMWCEEMGEVWDMGDVRYGVCMVKERMRDDTIDGCEM